jgi:ankyrin repeat protein
LQPTNLIASAPAIPVASLGLGLTVPEDLIHAARSGDISAFDALLAQASQKDLSYQDKEVIFPSNTWRVRVSQEWQLINHSTPLHAAVHTLYKGVTPLIAAVRAGRDDIVRKLIARDAPVNQQDSQVRSGKSTAVCGLQDF